MVPQMALGYTGDVKESDESEYNENDGVVEFGEGDELEENVELGESLMVEGVLEDPEPKPEFSTMAAHSSVTTLSGPTKTKKFVRYLTGHWAKANSYSWTKSVSTSSSVSQNVGMSAKGISSNLGVSNTITSGFSVGTSIPANKNKYSKLAHYNGYNKRYVRVRLWNTQGIKYSDKKTNHYAPRKDSYLQVVYEK